MSKYVILTMLLILSTTGAFGALRDGLITFLPLNGDLVCSINGNNGYLPAGSYQNFGGDAPLVLGTSQSAVFTGANGTVAVPNTGGSTLLGYTVSAWVKLNSLRAGDIVLLSSSDNGSGGWTDAIRLNTSGQAEAYVYLQGGAAWIHSPVLSTGVWYHIAATAQSSGEMKLYVNGACVSNCTHLLPQISTGGWRWVIGGGGDGNVDARIAGVGIWNRVLSAESIYSLATMANPFARYCGDEDTQYNMSDINKDCYVDFQDFAQMASAWSTTTDPFSAGSPVKNIQYIVVNFNAPNMYEVRAAIPLVEGATVQVGVGAIYTPLQDPESTVLAQLDSDLAAAEAANMPIVIQVDSDCWTGSGSLWNWWDPSGPGYDPNNKNNVEWYGWTSDKALKISWRNWGGQFRVNPAPNLMAPAFRNALHRSYDVIVPKVVSWWQNLPPTKKHLFIGFKVGWESSIGVNAWYYPNGNYYKETYPNDPSHDPTTGFKFVPPNYGVQQIGYAALVTSGLKTSGTITETDLATIVGMHLTDLCQRAMSLGLPREKIFTHTTTWSAAGTNYLAAVNAYSCPGWSYYESNTGGIRAAHSDVDLAVNQSGAPHWATPECYLQGSQTTANWKAFFKNTLDTRCKYLNIYNWYPSTQQAMIEAINQTINESVQ